MTTREPKEKPKKRFINLEEIPTQLAYKWNFPVNHNIAIGAVNG